MTKKKVKELTIEEKLNNALIPVDKQPYKIPKNWCWVKVNSISNIYTGNLTSHASLANALGDRLASRIWNTSTLVEFKGKDRRSEW